MQPIEYDHVVNLFKDTNIYKLKYRSLFLPDVHFM